MPKDIERELDAIFSHHDARVVQARRETAGKGAAEEQFALAAAACLTGVITPALEQMVAALQQRGVAARVLAEEAGVRIDIPVSRHARLGLGHGGYPYLRARSDRQTRRMHFERNTSDARGRSAIGDYAVDEVDADLVNALVVDLVRVLYGPF
ncbi:MAG: hypothetical protein KGJ68_01950 [Gammaproteobacteria bacterium]|nr:hypothetical protein [Gammaproteobacteria bacterium]